MEKKKIIKLVALCLAALIVITAVGVGIYLGTYNPTPTVYGREISWFDTKKEILEKESIEFEEKKIPFAIKSVMPYAEIPDAFTLLISKEKVDFMGYDATLLYFIYNDTTLFDVRYIIESDTMEEKTQKYTDLLNKCNEKFEFRHTNGCDITDPVRADRFVKNVPFRQILEKFVNNDNVDVELTTEIMFSLNSYIGVLDNIYDSFDHGEPPKTAISINVHMGITSHIWYGKISPQARAYNLVKAECENLQAIIESIKGNR